MEMDKRIVQMVDEGAANKIKELESELAAAHESGEVLHAKYRELEAEIAKYAGWAPDQFLRYQEEHKKLQKEYLKLDTEIIRLRECLKQAEELIRDSYLSCSNSKEWESEAKELLAGLKKGE